MKMKGTWILLIGVILTGVCTGMLWSGDGNNEKEMVIAKVQQFFDILASKDTSNADNVIYKKGFALSVRENKDAKGEEKIVRYRGFDTFAEELAKTKNQFKEVMSNPTVLIHKEVAVVWAPYKFYVDGKYSHKGVDAFTLIKTGEGWKIASVAYTVEFGEKK